MKSLSSLHDKALKTAKHAVSTMKSKMLKLQAKATLRKEKAVEERRSARKKRKRARRANDRASGHDLRKASKKSQKKLATATVAVEKMRLKVRRAKQKAR